MQREHNLALVAHRLAALIDETRWRRPQHVDRLCIFRACPVELRRHAGIAGHTPIGLPAGCKRNGDACPEEIAAPFARNEAELIALFGGPCRRRQEEGSETATDQAAPC